MSDKNSNFEYKEVDPEGFETLKVISDAVNFNEWTFDVINPYCSGRILEIGSGIGNISSRFIERGYDLCISDIRHSYREFLSYKFPHLTGNNKIFDIDLVHPDFESVYSHLVNKFDTVFSLNVIEHIENDLVAVSNCKKLLRPGGTLIILMPAFQVLYNNFDRELCHFKRYNRKSIEKLFIGNEIKIQETFYFNAGGMPGWFVSGKLFHNKTIPHQQMMLFDKLVPLFRLLDRFLMRKIGLSVVCVGTK